MAIISLSRIPLRYYITKYNDIPDLLNILRTLLTGELEVYMPSFLILTTIVYGTGTTTRIDTSRHN